MATPKEPLPPHVREIARDMGFMLEDELALLGQMAPETVETKRKRGELPPYVSFGRSRLYPLDAAAAFLRQRLKVRSEVPAEVLL